MNTNIHYYVSFSSFVLSREGGWKISWRQNEKTKLTLNLDLLYPVMLLSPALNSLIHVLWDKRILKYFKQVLNT